MSPNRLRKDYILDRWVAIAEERSRRPSDLIESPKVCVFCPGNEHMTPPASLIITKIEGKVRKSRDDNGIRRKDWQVRCVPNLFPAFIPSEKKRIVEDDMYTSMAAQGHHEVIIESPSHNEHPHTVSNPPHVLVIEAYIDRLKEFSRKQYIRYVSIIRNHKREAGASMSHPHSQIIAVPTVPRTIDEELTASREFWRNTGSCIYCSILKKEQNGRREIWQNNDFMVVSPWAAVHPYEFWILPKRHSSTLLEISEAEKQSLSEAIRTALGGLNRHLGDPPYNLGFHIMPKGFKDVMKYYHWHLEVYPQLAAWGGFEKSTGMFINTVSPEDAAADLRDAIG